MSLANFKNLEANIVIFAVFLLCVILCSFIIYIHSFRSFVKLPAWRLELQLPYWLLNRQKVDIVILKEAIKQARKYETEGLFVAWFFKPVVIVYGEEIVKSLLPYTADKPYTHKILQFAFGKGLFLSNGDRWKRFKKISSPAFHVNVLRSYVSIMNNNAKVLVDKVSEKEGKIITDISFVLAESTLRLFHETNLGIREGVSKDVEKKHDAIRKIIRFITYRFFRPWLFFDFMLPFFPSGREILKVEAENRKSNVQILEKVKECLMSRDRSQPTDEQLDCLNKRSRSIGEIILEGSPSMPLDQLARELNAFIFAGFDTTTHALMWTLYSLGLYPEIQDRVYEEVATLTEEYIQYDDVRNLTYLDCVIKESQRIFSFPFLPRTLTKDVQCGNYMFPKNTNVTIFASKLHRNPDIYPDPEKFDPERFMDKNSKIKAWNFMPFAEGPRPCIGKNYAMLSMKIFLISILQKFEVITLDRREDLTFKWSFVLGVEKEPRMMFKTRH